LKAPTVAVLTVSYHTNKNTHKMEARIANKDDARFIALLARITFTETCGYFCRGKQSLLDDYEPTFSVNKIENSISNPNNVNRIAFVNRLTVGFAKPKLRSQSEFIAEENVCQLHKKLCIISQVDQTIEANTIEGI